MRGVFGNKGGARRRADGGRRTIIGGGVASGAHAVASAALDAFVAAGASFVDDADIAAANATYRASMLFDERAPDDPSRGGGSSRPSCQKCAKRFGARDAFVDDYGIAATVKDVRFDAAHALRLIGYVLSLKAPARLRGAVRRGRPVRGHTGSAGGRRHMPGGGAVVILKVYIFFYKT